jgi:hypothetical protein
VGLITFNIGLDSLTRDVAADIFGGIRQPDAGLYLVRLALDSATTLSNLSLNIDGGDGFGIDDVRLGSSVAPVPVPAYLPLLAGGLGLMGWVARRRRKG